MAEEEEVRIEVEAVQSVYGNDCLVIERFPPHLHIHIKPRTADDSSQQFVEVVLGLRASPQYPEEPPTIDIMESKGLDEKRQSLLITSIREKACELSSCLMLVALCEEAVEMLSNMNHPDGNCPLCLYSLVQEDEAGNLLPFMKLMSCFHCFHSECIIRWWNWLQEQSETNLVNFLDAIVPSSSDLENRQDLHGTMKENLGTCPVCRKVFHAKDIEHVLDLVGTHSSQLSFEGSETEYEKEFLQSEAENVRRQKFEALLKLQEENSGLIEPKRNEVLLPGMFLPEPITIPTGPTKPTTELQHNDPTSTTTSETGSSRSSNKPSTSVPKGMRKSRGWNPKQKKLWIKKENGTTE